MKIVVLDFETANYDQDSACALGVCIIEDWKLARSERWLIRPPTNEFVFTYLHGLTWQHVCNAPKFEQRLTELEEICQGASYLAAHNAGFDRAVLNACMARTGRTVVLPPFINTVPVARHAFGLTSASLDNVSQKLKIALQHHDALSDAKACAEIIIKAQQKGYDVTQHVMGKPKKKVTKADAHSSAPPKAKAPEYHKGMALTDEQQTILESFKSQECISINAYAGTGKTKIFEFLAQGERRSGLYVAFNRDVSSHARTRFGPNINVRTIHGLALGQVGKLYPEERLVFDPSPSQIWGFAGSAAEGKFQGLSGIEAGTLIKRIVQDFCYSDAEEITSTLARASLEKSGVKPMIIKGNVDALTAFSKSAWFEMANPGGTLPLGHDGYLKVWGLSKPVILYDYILVDESQDINPVFIDVLKRQSAQICLVGDAYQQIYEWRGATNAASHFSEFKTKFLTKSWRFGRSIAELSNILLGLDEYPLRGNLDQITTLNRRAAGTFLFRYNGTLVEKAMELHAQNRPFTIAGGKQRLLTTIDDLSRLQSGERPLNPQMLGFGTWREFTDHHQKQERSEFRTFIKLIQQHGADRVRRSLLAASEEAAPNTTVLSTGHQAKGREWSSVTVSDDFLVPLPEPAEDRLLYVALTRSIANLNLSDDLFERVTGISPETKKAAEPAAKRETEPVQQTTIASNPTSLEPIREVSAAKVPSARVTSLSKPTPALRGRRTVWIWLTGLIAVLAILMLLAM